jgi:hypothetical protein
MGKSKDYKNREIRLSECERLVEKYKVIEGYSTNKELINFNNAIRRYGDNLTDLALELGYDIDILFPIRKPEGYYNNFENVKYRINKLIDSFGRFPTQEEINFGLGIHNRHLAKFGGMYEIKRRMNYDDSSDLKDDNGFFNKSIQEYYVAQFLIHNNISYKREGLICEDYGYLYDFLLEEIDDNKYYIEVWGYDDGSSQRADRYRVKMEKKIKIYKDCNLNLISISPTVFRNKSYEDINKSLYEVFEDIINKQFKELPNDIFIPSSKYTNIELKDEIMKYSKDGITIPSQSYLTSVNRTELYVEINRRYKSIFTFADNYNLKTEHLNYNYWNEDTIFETFTKMISEFGHILNKSECESEKYKSNSIIKGFSGGVTRHGGILENRIKYYEYLINNNKEIPILEHEVINRILNHKLPYNKVKDKYDIRMLKIIEYMNKDKDLKVAN